MTFRLAERYGFRAKIQFTTSARMPSDIYEACKATGVVSNTRYCQLAVVEALVRDLGLDRDELLAALPEARGPAAHLYDPREGTMRRMPSLPGPGNTVEEVR